MRKISGDERGILRSGLARPEVLPLPVTSPLRDSRLPLEEPSPLNLSPVERKELMVEARRARREAPAAPVTPTLTWSPYDRLTDLICVAKLRGLDFPPRIKKAALVELLRSSEENS